MRHVDWRFRAAFPHRKDLLAHLDLGDPRIPPNLLLKLLVLHDAAAQVVTDLRKPLEDGGLGEEVVVHGSWTAYLAGRPPGGRKRLPRGFGDFDVFFPEAVALPAEEHKARGVAAVNRLLEKPCLDGLYTFAHDNEQLRKWAPNFRAIGVEPPINSAYSFGRPGQVFGQMLAIPTDLSGAAAREESVSFGVDIHNPDKVPMLQAMLPNGNPLPISVPGFHPRWTKIVPIAQQIARKGMLLIDDDWKSTYRSPKEKSKLIFDIHYLSELVGNTDDIGVAWERLWPRYNQNSPVATAYSLSSLDTPEWQEAYDDWRATHPELRDYPPFKEMLSLTAEIIDSALAAHFRRVITPSPPASWPWQLHGLDHYSKNPLPPDDPYRKYEHLWRRPGR